MSSWDLIKVIYQGVKPVGKLLYEGTKEIRKNYKMNKARQGGRGKQRRRLKQRRLRRRKIPW